MEQMRKFAYEYDHGHQYFDFSSFLSERLEKNQALNILTSLNTCKCCLRHTINRPSSADEHYNQEKQKDSYPDNIKMECNCECRHYSRNIYRAINNIK